MIYTPTEEFYPVHENGIYNNPVFCILLQKEFPIFQNVYFRYGNTSQNDFNILK